MSEIIIFFLVMIDREFLWCVPTKTRRILTRSDASHKLRFSRRGKNVPYQQTHGGLEKCPKMHKNDTGKK